MSNETFQLEQQWCMVHYPEKPNGFAIFIIGDQQNYVNEETSFFLENKGKSVMIDKFTEAGYLVYYSNLFGRNWGNDPSVKHAYRLYQFIIRQEILNSKIHVLAEGMGVLIAIKLIPLMRENIRSVVLISPCISLDAHIKQEQKRKFFYKKLMKEIQIAFNKSEDECLEMFKYESFYPLKETKKAICIFQLIDNNSYKGQDEVLKELIEYRNKNNYRTKFHFIMSDNQVNMTSKMISIFKGQENNL
jgi:hypothetical protein